MTADNIPEGEGRIEPYPVPPGSSVATIKPSGSKTHLGWSGDTKVEFTIRPDGGWTHSMSNSGERHTTQEDLAWKETNT